MRLLSIVLGVTVISVSPPAGSLPRATAPKVEIMSVGHEGYLLRSGHFSVLLDGFLGPAETERDVLAQRSISDMLAGTPPFDQVSVVLVSHAHQDHFDPMVAGLFLEKHPETVMAVTRDVRTALQQGFPRYPAIKDRLVDVTWGAGGRLTKELHGVRVDFFKVAHEASQFFPDEVALHIVTINGVKILHGADAEMLHGELNAVRLEKEAIDVAILPYSFLAQTGAGRMFAEHVGAKHVVAMHLPAAELEPAKAKVRTQFPKAFFLARPRETVRL
jgi:L-ascorbate metabolism protein UlaG (beta-lactamase superfamily)